MLSRRSLEAWHKVVVERPQRLAVTSCAVANLALYRLSASYG